MIVRINQIDLSQVEADAGWPAGPHWGPLRADWPSDARAFELLILSEDEKRQPLSTEFRQHQIRQMIVQAAIALVGGGAESGAVAEQAAVEGNAVEASPHQSEPPLPLVLRLDGRVQPEELLNAWQHLTEPDGRGRYAFASSVKLDEGPADVSGSVQIVPSWRQLSQICSDPMIGLERSVRARLMAMPAPFLPVVLDAAEVDDPRWAHLLGECPLFIGTTSQLRSLQVIIRQADAVEVKAKIMQRLLAVARGAPLVPGS